MDQNRFDGLTRALGAAASRRTLGRALAGGGLSALFGSAFGTLNVDAKNKRDKKKKKPCPPCKKRTKQGKCTNADGLSCENGGTCQRGSCVASPVPPLSPPPPPPPPPACGAGGPCRVFLSSTRHSGNLGGLSGADAICQGLATAAGLPGTYKAWLSDNTSGASSRFVPSRGPYQLVNGTTIASNFFELTGGTLLAPIIVTETGGDPGGTTGVWTGTFYNGTPGANLFDHCANWSASGADGFIGTAQSTNQDWSTFGRYSCTQNTFHLYCFQQR